MHDSAIWLVLHEIMRQKSTAWTPQCCQALFPSRAEVGMKIGTVYEATAMPPQCTASQLAPSVSTSDLVIPFVSSHQCESLIQCLKPKWSTGCDTVSPIVLKAAPEHLSLPLSSIINSAISQEQFPSLWKSAIVHPLHKAGPTDICTNYRPNSILPAASKVMEMYVADLLKAHLEHNNLLYTLQWGFRQGHSTRSLLLRLTDSWYKSLDKGDYVGVVFLDLLILLTIASLLHKLRLEF